MLTTRFNNGGVMQTFLPYSSFSKSAKCLDWRRLGKQRVEAKQILNALDGTSKGWVNHPATKMWRGYEEALKLYMNVMITEWIDRGYNNSMELSPIGMVRVPDWFGDEKFHASHRSNLLRKDPGHYSKFGWTELDNHEYVWPV